MDQKANIRYVGNFNTGAIYDGGETVVLVRAITVMMMMSALYQHAMLYSNIASSLKQVSPLVVMSLHIDKLSDSDHNSICFYYLLICA